MSVIEITSPVLPTTIGFSPPFEFTNPIHAVFFNATCARTTSAGDVLTAKQAKAFISTAQPLSLNFNGLAALATSPGGNDLVRANFLFHSRTHWIDVKTGRPRELAPITVDNFLGLAAAFLPLVVNSGSGVSVSRCAPASTTTTKRSRATTRPPATA